MPGMGSFRHVELLRRRARRFLSRREEAYVAGRYLAREFEREEAEECVRLARELLALVEELEGAAFGQGGR